MYCNMKTENVFIFLRCPMLGSAVLWIAKGVVNDAQSFAVLRTAVRRSRTI